MIYIRTRGRLGNQMFYYAVARKFQIKNPFLGAIVFVPEKQTFDEFGGMRILDFNVRMGEPGKEPVLSASQKAVWRAFRVLRKTCYKLFGGAVSKRLTIAAQPILNRYGLYAGWFSEKVPVKYSVPKSQKNIWMTGLWENPSYFQDIRPYLLKELTPKNDLLPHNRELFDAIRQSNSVCMSIRRGDYLAKENDKFNVCTMAYFQSALKKMKETAGDFSLFVFSDDVDWCRDNIHYDGDIYFEGNHGKDPVWEKIRLMSACRHFIIANSTFSWWAQYLSDSPDKVVIAPRPWRKDEYCDSLYDQHFILLDGTTGETAESR